MRLVITKYDKHRQGNFTVVDRNVSSEQEAEEIVAKIGYIGEISAKLFDRDHEKMVAIVKDI